MKKLSYCLSIVVLLSMLSTTQLKAATIERDSTLTSESSNRAMKRLEEIKAMDVSTMSKSEKRVLRKELREMKKKASSGSGGVYLSVGAVIIIILLLIILL